MSRDVCLRKQDACYMMSLKTKTASNYYQIVLVNTQK